MAYAKTRIIDFHQRIKINKRILSIFLEERVDYEMSSYERKKKKENRNL